MNQTERPNTKTNKPAEAGNALTGMFKRLPSEQLKKLAELVSAELDRRGPKDVGGMSDSEFRNYVDEQFRKADRAAREADVRTMLGGKNKSKLNPTNEKDDNNE